MSQLEELQIFVRVTEAGGIGKAAEQLGIAKSAVSRRLSELEKRLGAQLISRTTRKSSLTEAGARCYEHALRVVDVVSELNAAVAQEEQDISGLIRVSFPNSFAHNHMLPVIDDFIKQYPSIQLDIDMTDRYVDLVASGLDLAIRIGELKDSSLKARKIAPVKTSLVASPDYLNKHGRPTSIEELNAHNFLQYSLIAGNEFKLEDADGTVHLIHSKPQIAVNNGDFLLQLAKSGHGILYSPTFISWQAVRNGELELVLPELTYAQRHMYAVYPQTRFLPKRVRLFIDHMVTQFGDEPYWDQPS